MTAPTSHSPRQPRRWGRKLFFFGLGLICLLVGIVAALPYLLNLESIKSQVIAQAEHTLKRKVQLGQIRLQLFTGLGAGLTQLTVANPPGWQQPHFIKVDTLSVKVAFWPLLERKVEVSKIILSDGQINVERNDQGQMNYADLMSSEPVPEEKKPEKPTGEAPPLASLEVAKISLQNVDIAFIDRAILPGQTHTTTANNVQIDLNNISLDTPIDFDISVSLLADGDRNVHLHGQVGPLTQAIAIDQAPLNVTAQINTLSLAPLTPYLGPQPPLTEGQLNVDMTLQGTLGESLGMKGRIALDNARLPAATEADKPTALPNLALTQDLTLDLANARLQLTEAQLDIASLQTTVKGTIQQFTSEPQLDLQLSTNSFAITQLLSELPMLASAIPDTTDIKAIIQLHASVKGNLQQLQSTSKVAVKGLDLKMADSAPIALPHLQFSHDATVDVAKSVVNLTHAHLDLSAVKATLSGTITQFDTMPNLDLTFTTTKFSLGELINQLPMLADALPKPANAQGHLKLSTSIKGTLEKLATNTQVTADQLSLKSGAFNGGTSGDGLLLELADMHTTVLAKLASPQPPNIRLTLKANHLKFDQQATETSTSGKPAASGSAPTSNAKPLAPPVTLRGKVEIAAGQLKTVKFQNLAANLTLIDGQLDSTQTLTTFGGNLKGTLKANLAQVKPDYHLNMSLANINAGNVVNDFTSVPNILFGLINTNLQFSGKGFDWDSISTTLTGDGQFQLSDLKITSLDLMPKLAKSLDAVSSIAGFTIPADLAERSFNAMKGTLKIKQGKVYSNDLKLWGPDLEFLGKGFLGLDQSLQVDGAALLLGKLAKSFGKKAAFLLDKKGRLRLPVTIKGTVTRPQISLSDQDLTALARKAIGKKFEKKATKEISKLINKNIPAGLPQELAKGLAGSLFGAESNSGTPTSPNGTAPNTDTSQQPDAAETQQQEPLKQLEKGLKSLFGR